MMSKLFRYDSTAFSRIILGLCFFIHGVYVHAINSVHIKKETPAYTMNVTYPQGFEEKKIDLLIKKYIDETQKSFLNELSEDEDTPADAPGKTHLNVIYSVLYNAKTALSIRFDVSIYHRGAAHPLNTIVINNFLKTEPIKLADLFLPQADYLPVIAAYCKKIITSKKISDSKWIEEGTKVNSDNYSVWYFTDKGISVVFNTYQVAAYVYGEQIVAIPLALISSQLKPEIIKMLWNY